MMVSTNEALLEQLKASQIFSAEELQKAAALIGDQDDSKSAARKLVGAGLLTRWQAGQLLKPGKATLVLGKYVLLDRLPWGSSHAVFLAKHPTMDRKVALNVLDKTSSARSDAVKSFLADARAIASLDHRHLIHVYDIDEADNRYFLVMEHVEGRNLHDAVKASGKLSIETAADVMRQIADGLDHAHRSKLIHGGLRPTNVLLDGQGTVKIIDLGVSKFDDPTKPPAGAADDSQVMEVANFLSPEQAAGGAATAQSDLYSLGCIGYLLLTGEPPFGQGDYATRLANHQSESPPDVRTRRSETPEGFTTILQKLMAKAPGERYGSAKDVVSAIESWWTQYAAQLEAAKPKAKPKPAAKPPLPKGAAPAADSKPAPVAAPKPMAAKPSTAKPALTPVTSAESEAEEVGFPGINLKGPKKTPAKPAAKPAGARPSPTAAATADSDAMSDSAETIPALVAPKGKKSPPALPAKKAARNEQAEAADESSVATSLASHEKKSSKLPLILAAVGGGVVLLLLLIGGGAAAYFLLGKPASTEVAATTPTNTEEQADDGDEPETESSGSEESESDDGEETPAGEDEPAGEEGSNENPPVVPPVVPPTDPVPPVDPPVTDPPPTDNPTPPDPPKTNPEPEPQPPTEQPKPPDQPKPADPFTALAAAVTLPALKDAEKGPFTLGAMEIPADSTCYIDLVGGDKASPKEGVKFSMDLARGGLATRDWEIKLVGTPRGDVNIATLALTDKELKFQWLPDAAKFDDAGYLANCQLNLRTADHDRYLRLRQPQEAAAIAINLNRASFREKFEIPFAPNPETITIEIVKVDGVEKATIDPKNLLSAKQDSSFVWFGDGEDRILGLRVDAMMQKDLQLSVSPVINDATNGPTKLVVKKVAALKGQMIAGVAQLNARVQALKASPNAGQLGDTIAKAQVQLDTASKSLDAFDKLDKQYDAVNGKASVQFRIYYTDGEHQVDLVRAKPADAATAPAEADPAKLDIDGDGK